MSFLAIGSDLEDALNYQRITIRSDDHYFSVYCTQESLEHRRDEIILWADGLARRLHWQTYETIITPASVVEATERKQALFDHRFPAR